MSVHRMPLMKPENKEAQRINLCAFAFTEFLPGRR